MTKHKHVYEKPVRSYDGQSIADTSVSDDFIAPDELMVHVTLHEYRQLVASTARLAQRCADLAEHVDDLKKRLKTAEDERDTARADFKIAVASRDEPEKKARTITYKDAWGTDRQLEVGADD